MILEKALFTEGDRDINVVRAVLGNRNRVFVKVCEGWKELPAREFAPFEPYDSMNVVSPIVADICRAITGSPPEQIPDSALFGRVFKALSRFKPVPVAAVPSPRYNKHDEDNPDNPQPPATSDCF